MNPELIEFGTACGTVAAAVYAFLSHRQAKQANDAVNHHDRTGTPRLYDLMIRTDQRVDELVSRVDDVGKRLETLESADV